MIDPRLRGLVERVRERQRDREKRALLRTLQLCNREQSRRGYSQTCFDDVVRGRYHDDSHRLASMPHFQTPAVNAAASYCTTAAFQLRKMRRGHALGKILDGSTRTCVRGPGTLGNFRGSVTPQPPLPRLLSAFCDAMHGLYRVQYLIAHSLCDYGQSQQSFGAGSSRKRTKIFSFYRRS